MANTLIPAISEQRLSNGVRLVVRHVEGAPRLALSFFIPGGNWLDPKPGVTDLMDRLLMKGTRNRSQEQLAIDIDGLTLELDVDTKRDFSVLMATLLEEDLEPAMDLVADLFFEATFSEFEREKERMSGEILMELDSPKARAYDLFMRTVFEETPYGTVSSVIAEYLPELERVDLLRMHYGQVYRPDRLVVSAAGDFSPLLLQRLIQLLESVFPEPGGPVSGLGTAVPIRPLKTAQTVSFARDDSSQLHLYQGYRVPSANHSDMAALSVLNTLLGGGGLSSRLFLELRDKQGLAYNVRSSLDLFKHQGLFTLYIGTEPSNRQKCLDGFAVEIDKLVQTPVSEAELNATKQNLLGRRSLILETAPQQAHYTGVNLMLGRSIEYIEALPQRIQAVTASDVQRVAQTYLTQANVVAVVGPSAALG
jgi:zinc protease